MARWEYCRLSWAAHAGAPQALDGGAGEASGGARAGLDHRQQHGPTGLLERVRSEAAAERITRLDATIARLGRAGWELVSHVQLQDAELVQHWYFKRVDRRDAQRILTVLECGAAQDVPCPCDVGRAPSPQQRHSSPPWCVARSPRR
jgi:hypothetical protein